MAEHEGSKDPSPLTDPCPSFYVSETGTPSFIFFPFCRTFSPHSLSSHPPYTILSSFVRDRQKNKGIPNILTSQGCPVFVLPYYRSCKEHMTIAKPGTSTNGLSPTNDTRISPEKKDLCTRTDVGTPSLSFVISTS